MPQTNGSLEYEKVINYIYSKMKAGELIVGSKLPTERALAEKLRIGRNSAREALSMLRGMGMIESVHGSGNYIVKNAHKAIGQMISMMLALGTISNANILEFRRILEISVCSVVAEKGLSEEQKAHLKEILSEMKGPEKENRLYLDKEFHDSLIRATENSIFITIMDAITDVYLEEMREVIEKADDGVTQQFLKIHEEIYQGVVEMDSSKALTHIEEHFKLVEKMMVSM